MRIINGAKRFTLNLFNMKTVSHFRQFCNLEVIMVICVLTVAVGFNLAHLYSYSSTSAKVSLGSDMVMHLLLSEAVVSAMVEGWNVTDVWEGSMGMGHPVFHYYQHLPHLIVGLINVVTFGAISVGNILIWSTYLLLSVFPLSIREVENLWIPLSDGTHVAARMWQCPPRSRCPDRASLGPHYPVPLGKAPARLPLP